jgi:hypothetical protein
MNELGRMRWGGAIALFLAGCVVTFLVLRYWQRTGASVAPVAQVSKTHWRIEAELKPPRTVLINDPDKVAILSFEFSSLNRPPIPYLVRIRNLTDGSFPVAYQVFAYDAGKRRVGEADDNVVISRGETVLRQLYFSNSLSPSPATYASFRLVADIEH